MRLNLATVNVSLITATYISFNEIKQQPLFGALAHLSPYLPIFNIL